MKNYLIIGGAIVGAILVLLSINGDKQIISYGAIDSGPNKATTTYSFGSVSANGSKLLKTGSGVLSAVIITNETAGSINFYDGTTTSAHALHATTTLFNASASLAENEYEINVAFTRGLLLEFPSTNVASATITWR